MAERISTTFTHSFWFNTALSAYFNESSELKFFNPNLAFQDYQILKFIVLTLFQAGSGITSSGGGAIMARTDFRLSKMTKSPVSAQNLLSNEYFDL